jgi:8-amino-7-oxononanoate synthase
METMSLWDNLVEEALAKLQSLKLLRSLRPIQLPSHQPPKAIENETQNSSNSEQEDEFFQVFDKMQPWDRSSVEVQMAEETFQRWICDLPSTGTLLAPPIPVVIFFNLFLFYFLFFQFCE